MACRPLTWPDARTQTQPASKPGRPAPKDPTKPLPRNVTPAAGRGRDLPEEEMGRATRRLGRHARLPRCGGLWTLRQRPGLGWARSTAATRHHVPAHGPRQAPHERRDSRAGRSGREGPRVDRHGRPPRLRDQAGRPVARRDRWGRRTHRVRVRHERERRHGHVRHRAHQAGPLPLARRARGRPRRAHHLRFPALRFFACSCLFAFP